MDDCLLPCCELCCRGLCDSEQCCNCDYNACCPQCFSCDCNACCMQGAYYFCICIPGDQRTQVATTEKSENDETTTKDGMDNERLMEEKDNVRWDVKGGEDVKSKDKQMDGTKEFVITKQPVR